MYEGLAGFCTILVMSLSTYILTCVKVVSIPDQRLQCFASGNGTSTAKYMSIGKIITRIMDNRI